MIARPRQSISHHFVSRRISAQSPSRAFFRKLCIRAAVRLPRLQHPTSSHFGIPTGLAFKLCTQTMRRRQTDANCSCHGGTGDRGRLASLCLCHSYRCGSFPSRRRCGRRSLSGRSCRHNCLGRCRCWCFGLCCSCVPSTNHFRCRSCPILGLMRLASRRGFGSGTWLCRLLELGRLSTEESRSRCSK